MSTRITEYKPNHYIAENYQSPWGTEKEGLYSLPKETMTKIFHELDPASQTAASFTARAFKEIHPPIGQKASTFCVDAAQAGHMELIRWGVERGYSLCNAIESAIRDGNLDLLKSLVSFGGSVSLTHVLIAVRCGRLNILKWMYENMGSEKLWQEVFKTAMTIGDLNILNWFHDQRQYDFETRQPK